MKTLKEYVMEQTDQPFTYQIVVSSEALKQAILTESKFVHDNRKIDIDACDFLAHLYLNPDKIIVKDS
jgi:hypothetical protein